MFRLTRHLNLFLPCFWLLALYSICQHLTLPAGRPGLTPPPHTKRVLIYMVMLPVRWWKVGSILNEGELPFPFPIYRYVIYLWLDSRE